MRSDKGLLLGNECWTQKQIAQVLRIHETTVWGHVKDYLLQETLKPINGGSSSKLNEQQTIRYSIRLLNSKLKSVRFLVQLGIPFFLICQAELMTTSRS